jgi:hypothetical protein
MRVGWFCMTALLLGWLPASRVSADEPLGVTHAPYAGLPAYLQPSTQAPASARHPVPGRPLEPRERERLDLLLHAVETRGSMLDARSSPAERASLTAEVEELAELARALPAATGLADQLVGIVQALPVTQPERVAVLGGRIVGLVSQLRARLAG